mgnify:CR=1 FL=1
MPSVLIEIPFGEYAELFKLESDAFMELYREVKRDLLFETKREFNNYRVRAGVKNRSFISTIYLTDVQMTLRVMIPQDFPSANNKTIVTLSKAGNPILVHTPISGDNVWISDGITKKTFLTRLEEKYNTKLIEVLLIESFRRIL